jgi:hypothetical protein
MDTFTQEEFEAWVEEWLSTAPDLLSRELVNQLVDLDWGILQYTKRQKILTFLGMSLGFHPLPLKAKNQVNTKRKA